MNFAKNFIAAFAVIFTLIFFVIGMASTVMWLVRDVAGLSGQFGAVVAIVVVVSIIGGLSYANSSQ